MPNMPKRPERDLRKPSLSSRLPSLENLFPRTLSTSNIAGQEAREAYNERGVGAGLARGLRGAAATGLVAFPTDLAEAAANLNPVVRGSRAAAPFAKELLGVDSSVQATAPTPTPPATPVAAPAQGAVQPPARQPSQRDMVRNALVQLAQPGVTPAAPSMGTVNTVPDPVLPVPVDRTPRSSPVAGATLPQLPSTPTYGDLMAFRLNALQQGMAMLPQVGAERQTRRAEEEGREDDALNLDRFRVKETVRQGDQTNQIAQLNQARQQGNADRTADRSERRFKLDLLKELNEPEAKLSDQLKELNAEQEYFDRHWTLGPELGEVARKIGEDTGVPLPQLQDALEEEIADAGGFEPTPSNIASMADRLRKRVLEAR